MAVVENLTTAAFTVFALVLALVALRAWRHTRSPKVGFLVLGFALFFAKGVYFSVNLFTTPDWEQRSFVPGLIVDLLALGCFYLAVFRPSGT